jgi:Small Multidrug Resistance protein
LDSSHYRGSVRSRLGDRPQVYRRIQPPRADGADRYRHGRELFLSRPGVKDDPIGTGYAVWTGIGAAGTANLGIVLFAESAALPRLVCIAVIIPGIVGLKAPS